MKAMRPARAVLMTKHIGLARPIYRACGAYRRYRVQCAHMSYEGQTIDIVNMSRRTSRACTADVAHNGVCIAHGLSVHVARKACRLYMAGIVWRMYWLRGTRCSLGMLLGLIIYIPVWFQRSNCIGFWTLGLKATTPQKPLSVM